MFSFDGVVLDYLYKQLQYLIVIERKKMHQILLAIEIYQLHILSHLSILMN